MSTISSSGKVAYIYDQPTDTWYPVAGSASTSLNYSWSGNHEFLNDVTFSDVVSAKAGINNFQNPTARDLAIATPAIGTVVFIRQDNLGNLINQIQYYSSAGSWTNYLDAQFSTKIANHVLTLSDSGKVINMNSSTAITVTVPTNTSVAFPIGTTITVLQTGVGSTSFLESSGVTIRSKNSYKTMNTQYSGAQLIKLEANIWILIGDLKV